MPTGGISEKTIDRHHCDSSGNISEALHNGLHGVLDAFLTGAVLFLSDVLHFVVGYPEAVVIFVGGGVVFSFFLLFLKHEHLRPTLPPNLSSHSRRHRASISEASRRPQRKAARPSGFVQPGDSADNRTTVGPGRTVMPRISGVSSGTNLAPSIERANRASPA